MAGRGKNLTSSGIQILADTWCRRYSAWEVQKELEQVLHDRKGNRYYVYKCLCKHKGEILEGNSKMFRFKMAVDPNRHLLEDRTSKMFVYKVSITVQRVPLRSRYNDEHIVEYIVYR